MPIFGIGVAGGSGSGKTTLAHALKNHFAPHAKVLSCDSYYRNLGHVPDADLPQVNWDHPEVIDIELLRAHLVALCEGHSIDVPIYDFRTNRRLRETTHMEPPLVLIVEGILVLHFLELVQLFDLCLFVEAPAHMRLARRIVRDGSTIDRSRESVERQWKTSVEPMYEQFVAPSAERAHARIDGTVPFEPIIPALMRPHLII